MLALSLGTLILLLCWIAAHVFAAATVFLLDRKQAYGIFLLPFRQRPARNQILRYGRIVYFTVLVFSVDSALAVATSIEPVYTALLRRVQILLDYEVTQGVMVSLLDFLLLSLGLFMAYQLIVIVNSLFPQVYRLVDSWRIKRFRMIKIQNLELLTPDQLTDSLLLLITYLKLGTIALVGSICLTFIFNYFPGTQGFVSAMVIGLIEILRSIWASMMALLPNIITLLIIIVLTRYSLKLLHFFFQGFRRGKIRFAGFHPELVEPTYQILRFLILALALVAAFPYIPGSDSPVFRGISIFVGFLLSLGSTSLVTNIISGVVITYTRGLKVGDRVQIGEAMGDVVERNLLVTRIRTIKNIDITIPNGMLLNNHIINFTATAAETGVILHTTVTLGYDVPWRKIHLLMKEAALDTEHILPFPEPFVLQTSLDDYYVQYEINAYTMKPARMATIYSELHQQIQDKFNEAEIEILSPRYTAVRDGQTSTIPQDYLPRNYSAPSFRMFSVATKTNPDR
jgi:small-conductance mechanosensitive channel